MDFERIKQNLRLRSGRSSKRAKAEGINGTPAVPDAWDPIPHHGYRPSTAGAGQHAPDTTPSDAKGGPGSLGLPARKEQTGSPIFSFNSTAPLPLLPGQERKPSMMPMAPPSLRRRRSLQVEKVVPIPPEPIQDPNSGQSSDEKTYDLKAPPPNVSPASMEVLSEMLFSSDHLTVILKDARLFSKFTAFVNNYRPHSAPVLVRYLETAKAIKAVQYANALASGLSPLDGEKPSHVPLVAAMVDARFESKSRRCFEILLQDLLPPFVTFQLVKTATDFMIKDITGGQMPMMRDLVSGLTEVFCITDPNLPDNPIIFASSEFYRMTGYNRDAVIGRNCRFLQGYQKKPPSIVRLRKALDEGHESSETLLNYRRDGTPFLNCLNVAPLLDDNGKVRYFIGAQVDVSGLVEDGRGLDSFERLLMNEAPGSMTRDNTLDSGSTTRANPYALSRLRELSEMFDLEESAVVQSHSRNNSLTRDADDSMSTFRKDTARSTRPSRRVILDNSLSRMDSIENLSRTSADTAKPDLSTLPSSLNSGRLPGIYQNYFLIRPHPSLRIVFVSPSLLHLGKDLLQSRFISHVSAPENVLSGIKEAFVAGAPVTAKVTWHRQNNRPESNGTHSTGQTKWMTATPLFGSDDRVGVWMVIMIDRHTAKSANRATADHNNQSDGRTATMSAASTRTSRDHQRGPQDNNPSPKYNSPNPHRTSTSHTSHTNHSHTNRHPRHQPSTTLGRNPPTFAPEQPLDLIPPPPPASSSPRFFPPNSFPTTNYSHRNGDGDGNVEGEEINHNRSSLTISPSPTTSEDEYEVEQHNTHHQQGSRNGVRENGDGDGMYDREHKGAEEDDEEGEGYDGY